jgi:protein TonB
LPAAAPPTRIEPGDAPPPVVTPPRVDAAYLANPAPEYPPAALRAKQQGQVLLRVLVGADGHVRAVEVERGCGYPLLDAAAVAAVSRWTFTPGHRGAVAVEDRVLVPIQFKLRS